MREASLRSFTKATECPECGAPLNVINTAARVVRQCSEDYAHYISETPVPPERKNLALVTKPKTVSAHGFDADKARTPTVEIRPADCVEYLYIINGRHIGDVRREMSPQQAEELNREQQTMRLQGRWLSSTIPPAELTYEPDDTELAERAAIQAEALGIEFDAEGEIARIPAGVDDDTYLQTWLALRAGA